MTGLSGYLIMRIGLTAAFGFILFFVLSRINRFKVFEFIAALAAFFAISAFVPVENIFTGFENPISTLNYQLSKPAVDVIESEDFAVVLYKKNEKSFSTFITPKRSDSYKLPMIFNNSGKLILTQDLLYPNLSLYYCHSAKSDKAIFMIIEYGASADKDRYAFRDSQDSSFKQLPKRILGDELNEIIVAVHYAELDANDKDYSLFINDVEALSHYKLKK